MSKKTIPVKAKKKIHKKKPSTSNKPASPKKESKTKTVGELSPEELDNFYKFLCADLVYWLINPTLLSAGHSLMDRDAIVESEGLQRPSISDLKKRYLDSGKVSLRTPFDYTTDTCNSVKGEKYFKYKVVVTSAIPIQIFRIGEFSGDDFNQYSYAHFYLLKLMLEIVDKRFHDFVYALNEGMKHQHATKNSDSNPLSRSATNVKTLLSLLKTSRKGYIGISLPDLFAVDPQSTLMTHDLQYFESQQMDKVKYEHLYTYMYSKETSQAFCAVLVELLERKMENLEFELANSSIAEKAPVADIAIDQWLAAIPKTNTKERMKLAMQILGQPSEEAKLEKKVSWTTGELIFLFRSLQRCGIFIPKLDLSKITTAMGILTGKSIDTYYNRYPDLTDTQLSIESICDVKPYAVDGAKNSIRKLAIKIKNEMDALIEEIKKIEN